MDDQGWLCGWDPDIMRMTNIPLRRDHNGPWNYTDVCGRGIDEWRQGFGFGSAHPGGMNALFGDGSVRNVSFSADPNFFWRAGGRNDGSMKTISD
jgi:prepilin-type processing-associated H-X9-DG protein